LKYFLKVFYTTLLDFRDKSDAENNDGLQL